MRDWEKALLWGVSGALVGFGLIGIASIGLPFLVVGLVALVFASSKAGLHGIWAGVVGFGAVPALVFLANLTGFLLTSDLSCSSIAWGGWRSAHGVAPPSGGEILHCSSFPGSYIVVLAAFSAIALSGVGWRILRGRFA